MSKEEINNEKAGVLTDCISIAFKDEPFVHRKLKYFSYNHLPDFLQARSKIFYDAAMAMIQHEPVDRGEAFRALDRLLEAKDAYVRSFI